MRKLLDTGRFYFWVLFLFATLQCIGIAFFTRGFLLSRGVLPDQATCFDQQGSEQCYQGSHFKKAVVILIDALRFDFTIPVPPEDVGTDDENYHNHLTVLYETAKNHPENAVLLKFLADPPTTTLQRLKGITTGSLPTFIDAGSNFNGDTIDEDNLLAQLYNHGKHVAFVGDDTWDALFAPYLYRNLTFPYESLNVWDLYSVDKGVEEHLFPMIHDNSSDWDVLIGHFLGVDHCGHRYGPQHPAMVGKLEEMDQVIRDTMKAIDDDTVLFVFGDHGMDPTGNHGGESQDELESALFMYTKKPFFGHLDESRYDVSDLGRNYGAVNQIDFVPTVSMLLGLPIPFNSLGSAIKEAFLGPKNNDYDRLAKAMQIATGQINQYRQKSSELSSDSTVNTLYNELDPTSPDFIESAYNYQQTSLGKCKERWATFDDSNIAIGIGLMAAAWALLVIYSKLIPSVVIIQLNPQILASTIALVLVYMPLLASFTFVFRPASLPLIWAIVLAVALGIINGTLAPIMDRYSVPWLAAQVRENLIQNGWTYLALFFILLHSLVFTSNSFIIWEDRIVAFWLATFGGCAFFKSFQLTKKRRRYLGAYHAIMFVLLTRLATQSRLCREEQGDKCTSTFSVSPWAVGLLYVSALLLPLLIRSFYEEAHSYEGAAPSWISKGLRTMMLLTAIAWTVEYLEHDDSLCDKLHLSFAMLKTTRMIIARVVMGVSLVAANIAWSQGPFCVRIEMHKNANVEPNPEKGSFKTATIVGYGNAYGSLYFLFVINALSAILIANKPMAGLSLAILAYQLLTLLELVNLLNIRSNLISVVVVGLLGYLHFFSTGHQATLQSIHWDSAFILTETITFPFTHICVLLDTLGPFILLSIGVTLLTFWKRSPGNKPGTLMSKVVENATSLIIYQVTLTLSTMIMTNHFRRHLMVWKIFAPRYMLNALILIVMNVIIVFVTIGFACPRVLQRWADVFGV